MIKKYKFIKQLFLNIQEQKISFEDVLNLSKLVNEGNKNNFFENMPVYLESLNRKENFNDYKKNVEQERQKKFDLLLKDKLLNIIPNLLMELIIFNRAYWDEKDKPFKRGLFNSEIKREFRIKKLQNLLNAGCASEHWMCCSEKDCKGCNNYSLKNDISLNVTGDILFDSVNNITLKYHDMGFEDCYAYFDKKEDKHLFSELHSYQFKMKFFQKDCSLLMLACMMGSDDFIEMLIKKGCDINYKEPLQGKTALDLYSPFSFVDSKKVNYIKSLLDGSYKDGYYQVLYEKSKINNTVIENLDNTKKIVKL